MNILWDRLGLNNLTEEDLDRVREVGTLALKLWNEDVFAVWQELEQTYPENLAVKFGLVTCGYYEFSRPFHDKNLLESKVSASREYLLTSANNNPEDPRLAFVRAKVAWFEWFWKSQNEVNRVVPTRVMAGPEDFPESDTLLLNLVRAIEIAFLNVKRYHEYVPAFLPFVLSTLKSLGNMAKTVSTPMAVATLNGIAEELKSSQNNVSHDVKQVFLRLIDQAGAYTSSAIQTDNADYQQEFRLKALQCYRQIVSLENVPEVEFGGRSGTGTLTAYWTPLISC